MKSFKVQDNQVGMRADIFIASKFPQFARSALTKLFSTGDIQINQKTAKPGQKLRLSEKVTINDRFLTVAEHELELPVIYEDASVIVINKPAGVLSHGKGGLDDEPSVASFIRSKQSGSVVDSRAGIVHRLDRATSGVIICAKNEQALSFLQKQFALRTTQKTYLALVSGILKTPEAEIDVPIARNRKNPKIFTADSTGKTARTHYKLIKTIKGNSLVQLTPATGRTHQLRVHMLFIGHPIIGDNLYSKSSGRLMLHAWKLKITLPSKQPKEFVAPLPSELEFGL